MSGFDISVVIPAYNAGEFLADALDSIANQTYPVLETIVVDDGSDDDTEAVARRYGASVRYVKQANAGPAAARNHGIALASHPWIAFLDADDKWIPKKTASQVAILQCHPELALIASDMAQTDDAFRVIQASVQAQRGLKDYFTQREGRPIENALARLTEVNFIPTGTVLARRDVLQAAGGFPADIRYGEDLALWARIAGEHAIACLPDVHMLRRQHGDNATQATTPLFRDLVKVAEDIRSWGRATLAKQGVDADALVARAWADLGYSLFCEEDRRAALAAFRQSLGARFNQRAFIYNLACHLPGPLLYRLRHMKQRIG